MATRFVDFETKICADWLNTVDDAVFDALGTPQTPNEARQNIGAVEEAPNDGNGYIRKNLSWLVAEAALLHNDLGGRTSADAHPIGSITGLESRLTAIESKNTAQDTAIAEKLPTTTFDAFVTSQDARDDAQDTAIAGKADVTYVDGQNAIQDANTLALIVALG